MKNKIPYLLCACMQMAGLALAGPVTTGTDYVDSGNRHFLNYSYDFLDDGSVQLAGRIFLPDNYTASKKYPLLVFYQGNGQGGGDNIKNVVPTGTDEIADLRAAAQANDIILFLPQPMQGSNGWSMPGPSTAGLNMDMSMLQVANLQNSYSVDREKLYLTGFSMGGHAVWSMGGIHAGAIAALAPVDPNPGGLADSNAAQLVSKAVWGHNLSLDNTDGIRSANRARVTQIRLQDGKLAWPILTGTANDFSGNGLRYIEINGSGHHCNWAYARGDFYDWMLAQKNTTGWMRTGEKICFDFGSQQVASTSGTDYERVTIEASTDKTALTYLRPDSAGVAWNSSVASYGNNYGAAFAFAKTTTGRSTFVSLYVLNKFTDYYRTAATQTLFDANIGLDGWMTPVSGTGALQLQGLTPNASYKVEIFATTEQTGGAYTTTAYKIGSTVQPLTVLNNTAAKATFASVAADANGKMTLYVSGTSGSTYGLIGTLELIALSTVPVASPRLISVLSTKPQGTKNWDLAVYDNWTDTPSIEPRRGAVSGSHQVVLSFDQPVTGGTVSVWSGTATIGSVSFAGSDMTVNLTNVADLQYVTLALNNIQGIASSYNGMYALGLLCGDVDRNYSVNSADQSAVTPWYGWSLLWNNYIYDVDGNGAINSTDLSVVTSNLSHQLASGEYSEDITDEGAFIASVNPPAGGQGNKNIEILRDGIFPIVGNTDSFLQYDTYNRVAGPTEQYYGYTFTEDKSFTQLVFQEGRHFSDGGWWANGTLRVQVRQGGNWVDVPATVTPAYPNGNTKAVFGASYETYRFVLNNVAGDGIRLIGDVGGTSLFTSLAELQVWASPIVPSVNLATSGTAFGTINPPTGGGSKFLTTIYDGVKPAVGGTAAGLQYDTYSNVLPRIPVQCYGYTFSGNKTFTSVVFQEGMHFNDGGWWANGAPKIQVRQSGVWVDVAATMSPAYPVGDTKATFGQSYETYTYTFNSPVTGDGIQITGTVGGTAQFTSIGELEAWGY